MSNSTSQTEDTTTRELIFEYIVQYKRDHDGNTPSLREIAEACSLSSPSSVQYHLFWLEMEGRIRTQGDRRRAIEIVGASWDYPDASEGQTDPDRTGQDRFEPDPHDNR